MSFQVGTMLQIPLFNTYINYQETKQLKDVLSNMDDGCHVNYYEKMLMYSIISYKDTIIVKYKYIYIYMYTCILI